MMRLCQAVLLGTVGAFCVPAAQAGPIWSLDWQFGTNAVISNTGRSVIYFTPHNTTSSAPNATVSVATLTEKSSAPHPDPITHQNYGAYLKLTDLASRRSRLFWFSGFLSGAISKTSSRLTNHFYTATSYNNIHLGKELYTLSLSLVLPSPSNHFHGSLNMRVTDPPFSTPEPPSWTLAGMGLMVVGFGAWRRRRRVGQ